MDTLSCDTNCPHRAEATSPSTSSQELLYCAKLASNCPKKRAGRKKFRETRHPVYRGVRRRNGCKWVCEVREPNKKNRIWLGTYPTEEMAARAHDVAAMALRGRSACLNFADSAWMLPIPDTGDAEDIRRAAAEAAEMFRPTTEEESEAENSMSSTVPKEEEAANAIGLIWDDEKAFGMPALLEDLAEALLLPPPSSSDWDAMDFNTDMAFWSHF